jgi:hypothetical protein
MLLLRRLTAIASSLLLMQLTLLGGGQMCSGRTVEVGVAADSMDAMPGMHREAPPPDAGDNAGSRLGIAVHPNTHRGCDHSGAALPCDSMLSCAAPMSLPTQAGAQSSVIVGSGNLPEPLPANGVVIGAPEVPPPRA